MKLFGFEITNPQKQQNNPLSQEGPSAKTFALPQNEDGAVTVAGAGYYGTYVDLDGTFRNETQLITKYRELAIQPEMETALDEIVNEAIVIEDSGTSVEINLDDVKVPPAVKKRIEDEFNYVLKLLNFGNMGHDIFRRWYIDGRMFYHLVIDETNPALGIQELKYIDPRRIRKIREIQKMRDPNTGIELIKKTIEYYLYNERGVVGGGLVGGLGRGDLATADRLTLLLLTLEAGGVCCHRLLNGGVVGGGLVGQEHGLGRLVDAVSLQGQGIWQAPGRTLLYVAQRLAVWRLTCATVSEAKETAALPTAMMGA